MIALIPVLIRHVASRNRCIMLAPGEISAWQFGLPLFWAHLLVVATAGWWASAAMAGATLYRSGYSGTSCAMWFNLPGFYFRLRWPLSPRYWLMWSPDRRWRRLNCSSGRSPPHSTSVYLAATQIRQQRRIGKLLSSFAVHDCAASDETRLFYRHQGDTMQKLS